MTTIIPLLMLVVFFVILLVTWEYPPRPDVEDKPFVLAKVEPSESSEEFDVTYREFMEYDFGTKLIRIESPKLFRYTPKGHKITDAAGVSHFIPYGWIHHTWKGEKA